jgi:hypothetical protein
MVVHVCNPSYSGGGDWEDRGLRPARAKHSQDLISINKLGVMVHVCEFLLLNRRKQEDHGLKSSPEQKCDIYSKNN